MLITSNCWQRVSKETEDWVFLLGDSLSLLYWRRPVCSLLSTDTAELHISETLAGFKHFVPVSHWREKPASSEVGGALVTVGIKQVGHDAVMWKLNLLSNFIQAPSVWRSASGCEKEEMHQWHLILHRWWWIQASQTVSWWRDQMTFYTVQRGGGGWRSSSARIVSECSAERLLFCFSADFVFFCANRVCCLARKKQQLASVSGSEQNNNRCSEL